jgi:hypothetical protein
MTKAKARLELIDTIIEWIKIEGAFYYARTKGLVAPPSNSRYDWLNEIDSDYIFDFDTQVPLSGRMFFDVVCFIREARDTRQRLRFIVEPNISSLRDVTRKWRTMKEALRKTHTNSELIVVTDNRYDIPGETEFPLLRYMDADTDPATKNVVAFLRQHPGSTEEEIRKGADVWMDTLLLILCHFSYETSPVEIRSHRETIGAPFRYYISDQLPEQLLDDVNWTNPIPEPIVETANA